VRSDQCASLTIGEKRVLTQRLRREAGTFHASSDPWSLQMFYYMLSSMYALAQVLFPEMRTGA
jgi:hypothetical protein